MCDDLLTKSFSISTHGGEMFAIIENQAVIFKKSIEIKEIMGPFNNHVRIERKQFFPCSSLFQVVHAAAMLLHWLLMDFSTIFVTKNNHGVSTPTVILYSNRGKIQFLFRLITMFKFFTCHRHAFLLDYWLENRWLRQQSGSKSLS